MASGLPTALVGFGRMGQGYAADPVMARHFRYAAHAQVLRDHPAFDWQAVIDPAAPALAAARDQWGVPHCAASPAELGEIRQAIAIAVIATGPETRLGLLDELPALRAVLVEKPLGRNEAEAEAFLAECRARGILVAVNLWRRADARFRELAHGELTRLIGEFQVGTCLYGNGLINNGTHMVDFVRMLLGEIVDWQLTGATAGHIEGPIPGDGNPNFVVQLSSGGEVAFQGLRFADYRECGLELWGTRGKLEILCEGLAIRHYPRAAHRAMTGEHEIAVDMPRVLEPTCGQALYAMYDNIADCLARGDESCLWSGAASAEVTTRLVGRISSADQARR